MTAGHLVQNLLARIPPGSTAYLAVNDAFTAVAMPQGCSRLIVAGALDAAAYPILRLGATNVLLNNAVPLAASAGFAFEYPITGGESSVTVRFSANGNILHLIVAAIYG